MSYSPSQGISIAGGHATCGCEPTDRGGATRLNPSPKTTPSRERSVAAREGPPVRRNSIGYQSTRRSTNVPDRAFSMVEIDILPRGVERRTSWPFWNREPLADRDTGRMCRVSSRSVRRRTRKTRALAPPPGGTCRATPFAPFGSLCRTCSGSDSTLALPRARTQIVSRLLMWQGAKPVYDPNAPNSEWSHRRPTGRQTGSQGRRAVTTRRPKGDQHFEKTVAHGSDLEAGWN